MLCLNGRRGIYTFIILTICLTLGDSQKKNEEQSFSTSTAVMTNLLKTERVLIDIIEEELFNLERQINILRRFLEDIHIVHEKSANDSEAYISNPVNSFALIRRTYEGWPRIVEYLLKPFKSVKRINAMNKVQLPTRTDLQEAIVGLERIRRTYDLSPIDIAEGRINGVQLKSRLSSFELFTVGFQLYKLKTYDAAISWLNISLQTDYQGLLPREFSGFDVVKTHLLYVRTLLKLGKGKEALAAAKKAFDLYPENDLAIEMNYAIEKYYKSALLDSILSIDFELCCRETCQQRSNDLHCRHNTTMSPFHILAPTKMEEISTDPYIVIFHDVITDEEIQFIKDSARKEFSRAKVYDEHNEVVIDGARTSHQAHVTLQNVTMQKIIAITGFDPDGFEFSAVINYGLGGHYESHTDFFQPFEEEYSNTEGDRMATILIYLSDVEQGGATVFPSRKLAIYPQKGSLLLWYNLKNNGDADFNTVHGSCPVITGSKYVLTIWVREMAQFRSVLCYNP